MKTREQKVKEFMEMMLQTPSVTPGTTPLKMRQLAIKLTFEELRELATALDVEGTFTELSEAAVAYSELTEDGLKDGNVIDELEVIDAFGDIAFTNLWGVVMTGCEPTFDGAFNEICRSNNSKACTTLEEAKESQEYYAKSGTEIKIIPNGNYFILNDENGKVKKSINYSPASLEKYVPTK